MLVFFVGGILFAHKIPSLNHWSTFWLFCSITLCLSATLFFPLGVRLHVLLLVFFLTGALLAQEKPTDSRLMSLAAHYKRATIEGTVLMPIKAIDRQKARLKVNGHRLFYGDGSIPINENLIVTVYGHVPELETGDKIRFPARMRPFKNFNNPGRYDYELAMKLKGFTCAASVSDGRHIVPMGPGHLPFFHQLLEKMRRPIRELFKERLGKEDYALYRALILGERQGIRNELREPFNLTGLGHILAVSGLHIGLVAWIVFALSKQCLLCSYRLALKTDIRKLASLLTSVAVIGYALLAGFQVSTQRAMIMVLVYLWSLVLGREKEVWSTLALAGLIILFLNPNALFTISFQLSFAAVIGVIWLTPAILDKIVPLSAKWQEKRPLIHRLFVYVAGLIAVTLSATIFLLPIISLYFHRVSIVSIPANLTAIPILGFWVLPFGLLSVLFLPFSHAVASLFLQLGAWGLNALMEIIRFWSCFEWTSVWMVTPTPFEMLMFYLLILFILFFKERIWAKTGLAVLVILIFADVAYWTYMTRFSRDFEVAFLDVGKGNAAVVEFPGGKRMIIDGGGFPHGNFDVGKMVIAPYLWRKKIRRVDYMVLSHPQSDHMNGLRFIAKAFSPREFWYNGDTVMTDSFNELMAIVKSRKIKTVLHSDLKGTIKINGAEVSVLHPDPDGKPCILKDPGKRLNNNSLVLKISYRGKTFLFPGDLEKEGETILVANAGDLIKSDILLAPHHGSKTSSSKEFLGKVRPGICVISSGEGGTPYFPHQTVLDRLREIGCKVIRISRSGAVTVTVGQGLFEVNTFLDPEH